MKGEWNMKLKDKPLEWWKGRLYRFWCRADSKDERKINYTFNWFSIGQGWQIRHYTSEELVDGYTMYQIRNSFIHDIELRNDEWFVNLDYPFYVPDSELQSWEPFKKAIS